MRKSTPLLWTKETAKILRFLLHIIIILHALKVTVNTYFFTNTQFFSSILKAKTLRKYLDYL
jgi:hypothetical protein